MMIILVGRRGLVPNEFLCKVKTENKVDML